MKPYSDSDSSQDTAISMCVEIPEMTDRYLELVDLFGDDLGLHELYSALAELVAEALAMGGEKASAAESSLEFVERSLASSSRGEASGCDQDTIAYSFLDQLGAELTAHLSPELGPRTLEVLEKLQSGEYGEYGEHGD